MLQALKIDAQNVKPVFLLITAYFYATAQQNDKAYYFRCVLRENGTPLQNHRPPRDRQGSQKKYN